MLKALAKGLLGRVVAYGVFGLGFWSLFQGVQDDNIPLAVLGGAMIPAGLYLLVKVRRFTASSASDDPQKAEDGDSGDLPRDIKREKSRHEEDGFR